MNYDTEYDKFRRTILSIINDISSQPDPTLQRILYKNMGNFSVFFGRKMTIDNLIPLQTSCFNKKDFRLYVSQIMLTSLDRMPERYPLFGSEGRLTHTLEVPSDCFHALVKRSTRGCRLRNDRDAQQALAVRSSLQRGCFREYGIADTLFRT